VIPADEVATRFLLHLGVGSQDLFPVADPEGRLLGALTVPDLARIAREDRTRHQALSAREVAQMSEALSEEDTLLEAMRRMGARGMTALPVTDRQSGRLLGLLSQSDVLGLYGRILAGAPLH